MKIIPTIQDVIADFPEFSGIHPIANVFPMQQPEDFWELVENVRSTGLLHSIRREKETGLLIDGRNRLLACSITGTLFEVEDIPADRVLDVVVADNLLSKKFDASQRAIVAADLSPYYERQARERQVASGEQFGKGAKVVEKIPQPISTSERATAAADLLDQEAIAEGHASHHHRKIAIDDAKRSQASKSRDAAGRAAGVNGRYVDMAKQVVKVSPQLAESVRQGDVKLKDAHAQVRPIIEAAKAEERANKPAPQPKEKAQIVTVDGRITEIDKPSKPVFNSTNDSVSWAAWTWNPVTGCNHGCKFCYAREIAHSDRMAAVYPFQFAPAFHEYRLDAPRNTKRRANADPTEGRVFVCSMADLFGKWVPDEWIEAVFNACIGSPEWEYLFLTKWPKRYAMLAELPKAWFGASVIKQADVQRVTRDMTSFDVHPGIVRWISLEPMLEPITFDDISWCDLVVIGAQTSTTQPDAGFVPAFSPAFEWVADVVAQCREQGVPYYLKPNLATAPGMALTMMEPRRKNQDF
jgi:protein gp37